MAIGEHERLDLSCVVAAAEGRANDARAAISLARQLLLRARQLQTPEEERQQSELARLLEHPEDKSTLVEMTDQAFRTHVSQRVADQLTHLLDVQGVPRFFSPLERAMLRGFQSFGAYLPGVAVPLVKEKMRHETANVILPAEDEPLAEHLAARHAEGVRMNVNLLGEAILGEAEAERRLARYLAALQMPAVECISVKISTLYSQINPIDRNGTIRAVSDRLELLYRASLRHRYQPAGASAEQAVPKFVYLDMEEYRDLYLTAEILKQTLSRPDLHAVRAGIALQAYVPDSYRVLEDLAAWARERGEEAAPLTIRIVKGANLEMERVEASLLGLPQAPYENKRDTDANYKRMVQFILQHAPWLQLGLASHNLFDVALGLIWAYRADALSRVQFEMLEGMANHQRRALFEIDKNMLLYAPACRREEFLHAIGYLLRRLDENTGPQNFLRYSFRLEPDSETWCRLAAGFADSLHRMQEVPDAPRRRQDRRHDVVLLHSRSTDWRSYRGEPDTDWSLPQHADWATELLDQWQTRVTASPVEVPLSPSDGGIGRQDAWVESRDPSRPGVVVCRYQQASDEDMMRAIEISDRDPSGWRRRSPGERASLLRSAAGNLRARRADLIGAAAADGGKTAAESDPEVNEAVDFVEFYTCVAEELYAAAALGGAPRGVVAVVSPWNFPIAIPCGGVAAALAAGNTVILKPASETVLPAAVLCQCFWDAGIPREALQLVPARGSGAARLLATDRRVNTVVLTGGTGTARQMLQLRSDLHLIAETGGKNATIVSALADRELAIKHVLHSAFSHSGQKCSATSLLLLEEEVYHDRGFRETLCDAAASLPVGSAWDVATRVGPLIHPPRDALQRGIKELEAGESWLLRPAQQGDNPNLYSPGIKWGVRPGSFTHMTELFGPVLAVLPYRKLEQAIGIVSATGYGLTSGLETLDDREKELWQASIPAGNLYINRPTTGAIVLRQPFGGIRNSSHGPGTKAGGPNYVVPLLRFSNATGDTAPSTSALSPPPLPPPNPLWLEKPVPGEILQQRRGRVDDLVQQLETRLGTAQHSRLGGIVADYDRWAAAEYCRPHDHFQLSGQDNLRYYRAVSHLVLRVRPADKLIDVCQAIAAAHLVGCRPLVSYPSAAEDVTDILHQATQSWAGQIEFAEQADELFTAQIEEGAFDRVRMLGEQTAPRIVDAAAAAYIAVIARPVSPSGRIEPLWYLYEQSLSHDYHRYGNLGRRAT